MTDATRTQSDLMRAFGIFAAAALIGATACASWAWAMPGRDSGQCSIGSALRTRPCRRWPTTTSLPSRETYAAGGMSSGDTSGLDAEVAWLHQRAGEVMSRAIMGTNSDTIINLFLGNSLTFLENVLSEDISNSFGGPLN